MGTDSSVPSHPPHGIGVVQLATPGFTRNTRHTSASKRMRQVATLVLAILKCVSTATHTLASTFPFLARQETHAICSHIQVNHCDDWRAGHCYFLQTPFPSFPLRGALLDG